MNSATLTARVILIRGAEYFRLISLILLNHCLTNSIMILPSKKSGEERTYAVQCR